MRGWSFSGFSEATCRPCRFFSGRRDAADGVLLPAGRLDNLRDRSTFGSAQHVDHHSVT
jgi:hypothetical protein